jgi:hypothetical protein
LLAPLLSSPFLIPPTFLPFLFSLSSPAFSGLSVLFSKAEFGKEESTKSSQAGCMEEAREKQSSRLLGSIFRAVGASEAFLLHSEVSKPQKRKNQQNPLVARKQKTQIFRKKYVKRT